MRRLLIFCLAGFALATAHPSAAEQGMAIAAVAGDEAISSYDVETRIKFVLVTTRLSNTQDVLKRLRPQVIRQLIDERLQLQEAKKNDITVSDADVQQAIAGIEAQRGMKPGAIAAMLQSNRVPRETFLEQIRAQLAWARLVQKKIRPKVRVGEDEIDLARKRVAAPKVRQEMKIALLVLPVDKPARAEEVRRLGEKFVQEVRAGANFEELSRQFSSSKVESFWVRPEQLDPQIAKILEGAQAGMITDPLQNTAGFTIIKIYDTRSLSEAGAEALSVTLREIVLKLKADASNKEADVMLEIGKQVAKNPGKCEDKGIAGVEDLKDFDIQVNQIKETLSALPAALRSIAANLPVGGISPPFASSEGIKLYMLCEKSNLSEAGVDRDRVHQLLTSEKLQLEAQKYLRNLRRDSFIEIR